MEAGLQLDRHYTNLERDDGGLDRVAWWRWHGMVGSSIYFEDGAVVCRWIEWRHERKKGIMDAEVWDLSNNKNGIAIFYKRWERLQEEETWVTRSGI